MMLFVGVLSALISVNGAVAALLPVVVVTRGAPARPPSQLLMPLVFGAHAGSMLALTGTPVNVLVLEASLDAGRERLRLLRVRLRRRAAARRRHRHRHPLRPRAPARCARAASLPPDLSRHARTLVEQFGLDDGLHQLRVPRQLAAGRHAARELDLAATRRCRWSPSSEGDGQGAARSDRYRGRRRPRCCAASAEAVAALAAELGLRLRDDERRPRDRRDLFNRASGLAEVVIPPRSPLIGRAALSRHGHRERRPDRARRAAPGPGPRPAGEPLAAGDTLLLQGTWDGARRAPRARRGPRRQLARPRPPAGACRWGRARCRRSASWSAWCSCSPPASSRRRSPACSRPARSSCSGILSVEEVYRAINWTTVILVGAMMPLSTAMTETGAAQAPRRLADRLRRRLPARARSSPGSSC